MSLALEAPGDFLGHGLRREWTDADTVKLNVIDNRRGQVGRISGFDELLANRPRFLQVRHRGRSEPHSRVGSGGSISAA